MKTPSHLSSLLQQRTRQPLYGHIPKQGITTCNLRSAAPDNSTAIMEKSLLLRLPPELRNSIYELVFTLPTRTLKVDPWSDVRHGRVFECSLLDVEISEPGLVEEAPVLHPLCLTETCRQMRDEALPVFYSLHTFRLKGRITVRAREALRNFLELIGPRAASALRRVEIEMRFRINLNPMLDTDKSSQRRTLKSLIQLRQWSLQNPKVALSAHLLCTAGSARAVIDIQNLTPPVLNASRLALHWSSAATERVRNDLETHMTVLRAIKLEDSAEGTKG